jgi:hypothetical protein
MLGIARPLRNGGFVSPDKAAAQRIAELVKENETLQAKSDQETEADTEAKSEAKYLARNEPQITDRHRQWCEPCWGYQFHEQRHHRG